MNLCRVAALAAALTSAAVTIAHAQQAPEPKPFPEKHPNPAQVIHMINFAGGFNLPIWMTQRQGFFAAEKIDVKIDFTPGSTYQLTHLIAGTYDMGFTAIDNIIAYREGQNEAYLPPGTAVDLIAVLASDDGFLSISAQKDVASVEALKGRTVTVDAMTTGFAFVLREVLAKKGVAESEVKFERAGGVANRFRMMLENPSHAATTQMTPFDLLGEAKGFKTIARVREVLGPYLGLVACVRKSWAEANRDLVVRFIRAYAKGVEAMYDLKNRPIVEAILVANAASMTPELAAKAYDVYVNDKTGFFRRPVFDAEGAKTVLALRSKYGVPQKTLTDAARYYDTSYLEAAGIK
ncbi:MAG TPA: ABC transporter substrate-binding protein [Hyphomicrobiaceae bacterium]|nr:ABC transporter substrate-binding protein [Hyphomicrobiaceae bacterium]